MSRPGRRLRIVRVVPDDLQVRADELVAVLEGRPRPLASTRPEAPTATQLDLGEPEPPDAA